MRSLDLSTSNRNWGSSTGGRSYDRTNSASSNSSSIGSVDVTSPTRINSIINSFGGMYRGMNSRYSRGDSTSSGGDGVEDAPAKPKRSFASPPLSPTSPTSPSVAEEMKRRRSNMLRQFECLPTKDEE